MDSFELNKLIGAFLGVVFVVFSVSLVSDAIFAAHAPETPGYAIVVPDEPAEGEPVEAGPSALDLLASADPAAGEASFKRCASCHTIEQGGPNRVGPNLWGVVNRPVASHEGFAYSGAMKEFSEGGANTWTFENLSNFLVNPRGYVPGTIMAFAGLRDPQEEANLIAYLNQQSDSPAELPAPAAAEEAPAGEEAAAEGEDAAPAAEGEEAAPAAEGDEAPAADGAAPADEAAPAAGEATPADAAAPATDEAAPAQDATPAADAPEPAADEAAPADATAPAADEAAPTDAGTETEAAPAEATPEQDGTSAAPATDAAVPAADGEVSDEEQRAPAQD